MDNLNARGQVIVIGATNRPNSLDPALRHFGRFDREIGIGVPNEKERLEILRIHTKDMKLSKYCYLENIAYKTYGFVGADLAKLCTEAVFQCIREKMDMINIEDEKIDTTILNSIVITNNHFQNALQKIFHSSLRETFVDVVQWEDIGGLEDVKCSLQEMILYPLNHEDKYIKFDLNPSHGVLFYGPPGCGKTLMAKAIATEISNNFIYVKGSELLKMWYGESETNIHEVFDNAKKNAPCVLFFDQLDSIGLSRGSGVGGDGEIANRIINQILTEMDGIGVKENVFIIVATNRPDILNKALLRPGRLDQLIYFPLPDLTSMYLILKAILRRTPIDPKIPLDFVAKLTDGFSGADLKELCNQVCKSAIKEAIQIEEEKKVLQRESSFDNNMKDPVPFLMRRHFEYGLKHCVKSVHNEDLAIYEDFKSKYETYFNFDKKNILWPYNWEENENKMPNNNDDDLDLYS